MPQHLQVFPELWKLVGLMAIVAVARVVLDILEGKLREKRRLTKALQSPSYGERMQALTSSLTKASAEVERVLEEMALVSQSRERAISSMKGRLSNLVEREQALKAQVQALEKTALPVAEHFAALVEKATAKGDKRSAWRDYILFGLGVLVSTIITIIMKRYGY